MWTKVQGIKDTKLINIQKTFSSEEMLQRQMSSFDFDGQLKYEFSQKIAEEIMNNSLFVMHHDKDMYRRIDKYECQINLVDPDIHKAVIDVYEYEVQGIKFSHKEITEAVKNWKPEMFL